MKVDLNCDLGESFGQYQLGEDEAIMGFVTSANVACGLHAGDPVIIDHTVRVAVRLGLAVGAHPGYPDLQGFGRREMHMTPEEVEVFVLYQIGAVAAFTRSHGVDLSHVKPHGALYEQAAKDPALAEAVARATRRFSPELILVGLAGSALTGAGESMGLRVAHEAFPDRMYDANGNLLPRHLDSVESICAQAVRLARSGIPGSKARVDTLCLPTGIPGAGQAAAAIRQALEHDGFLVESLLKSVGSVELRDQFVYKYYEEIFPPEEKNEVLKMVVLLLWRILTDESDYIEVSPRTIRWFKKNRSHKEFPMLGNWATNFLEAFDRLMQKNTPLSARFKLIADKGYLRAYQVLPS